MEIALLIIILILFGAGIGLALRKKTERLDSVLLLNQQVENLRNQNNESFSRLSENINRQLESVVSNLITSQKTIGERLEGTNKVFADISKNLGSLEAATNKVFDIGKDISSLQEILRAPKLRGNIGEFLLGDLLSQILPSENYTLQYRFNSCEMVDAVIRLGQGMVPVDSKFPLENFRKMLDTIDDAEKKSCRKKFASDVKKHIDAISSKYILPDEGTFDFALMYIPAENVYYELIIKDENSDEDNISSYALSKRVIPTSPNSFYAYLQAIVLGLKGMKIDRDSKIILQELQRLKSELGKFSEDFDVLGKHLNSARNKYDDAAKKMERFSDRVNTIGEKPGGRLTSGDV